MSSTERAGVPTVMCAMYPTGLRQNGSRRDFSQYVISSLRNAAGQFGAPPPCGFVGFGAGYPYGMPDAQEVPDDVPVADAVEQRRATGDPRSADESAQPPPGPPLEAAAADWQDQLAAVDLDPEEDAVSD